MGIIAESMDLLRRAQQVRGMQEALELEVRVHETAPLQAEAPDALVRAKSYLVLNQSNAPQRLELNMLLLVPPALPSSGYYGGPQVPTVTTYGNIAAHRAIIRLPLEALDAVPDVLKRDVQGKKVDLFFSVVDGRHVGRDYDADRRPYNLAVHRWAYPDVQPGEDRCTDIVMGMVPLLGAGGCYNRPDALPLYSLDKRRVHAHPDAGGRDLLYSPDNAHFTVDQKSPLSAFWIAVYHQNRACFGKYLVLRAFEEDPIAETLVRLHADCGSAEEYRGRLREIAEVVDRVLRPAASGDAAAVQRLPKWHQNGVFKHAWVVKGSPCGVHADFGRLSFLSQAPLPEEHHCSSAERREAVRRHRDELVEVLATSQEELCTPRRLALGEEGMQLLNLALLYATDAEGAQIFFEALDDEVKDAVYFAVWQLHGCPREDHFGSRQFARSCPDARAQALRQAAQNLMLQR
jgi:hypothetical protein